MQEKTFTEENIQAKFQKWPKFLQKIIKDYLDFVYKENIEKEKMAKECENNPLYLKEIPPVNDGWFGTIVIGEENNAENNQKREKVKEILFTKYNENTDKTLHNYFVNNHNKAIHKWFGYFDIYEKHFSRFRGKNINILEIGVQNGGSARMWRDYFSTGNNCVRIFGVDVNPKCKALEEEGIEIFIGSQEDRAFLRDLKNKIPPVDILIDDGGHTMNQQIVSFEELFDFVKDEGVYLCEDTHTSYWEEFGGGKNSFINYTKNLIDELNAYYAKKNSALSVTNFTKTAYSITYYDSVVVIEKRIRPEKWHRVAYQACIGKSEVEECKN